MSKGNVLFDSADLVGLLDTLAEKIVADYKDRLNDVVLVGILSTGFPLAERLSKRIEKHSDAKIPVGKLDVALYRDDLYKRGGFVTIRESDIPFSIEDKILILVDDVFFRGRTIRAALNALLDFGRPDCIRLSVLIDRGHRELPILPDYVGRSIQTSLTDHVRVSLLEVEGEDAVILEAASDA